MNFSVRKIHWTIVLAPLLWGGLAYAQSPITEKTSPFEWILQESEVSDASQQKGRQSLDIVAGRHVKFGMKGVKRSHENGNEVIIQGRDGRSPSEADKIVFFKQEGSEATVNKLLEMYGAPTKTEGSTKVWQVVNSNRKKGFAKVTEIRVSEIAGAVTEIEVDRTPIGRRGELVHKPKRRRGKKLTGRNPISPQQKSVPPLEQKF